MTCQFMTNKKEKINENPPVVGGPLLEVRFKSCRNQNHQIKLDEGQILLDKAEALWNWSECGIWIGDKLYVCEGARGWSSAINLVVVSKKHMGMRDFNPIRSF